MKLSKVAAASAAAVLALSLAACSGDASGAESEGYAKDADTLVMGMVPDQQSVENNFQPLVDYIEEVTGKNVELIESANYAALVEAAIAGRIDIGSFSGFTFVAAQNGGANLIPIGVTVTQEGEEPGYESVAIVPAGSDITSIEGFRGKNVCFVDPGSTSGYLYPSAELLAVGIDPETDITPVFAGGHDASAQKTAQGVECDAGFAEDAVVDVTGVQQGLFAEGDLVSVNRTTVPGAPLVISGNLPQDVQDELTSSLQNITRADIEAKGIEITEAFAAYFFELVPVEDSYYDSVRLVCEQTGAAQCTP
ncbi:phosphate/phosphite/phosphonate ABC transporter substrate-binding protein [Microbacterium sp. NIBRBAC000506063]|uniref:phosphate/phosphite/phosphonate ABC transporter substrate-binding protein n=1 Tax=Microbacterium sp. NIBRBAC000506063 TaxID=2734618 RepID=UPI001BB775E7|nr:phosphate/phosphite/phosphonate ABC transporter substrate-binding protein [Microbacterium sp. NIBRBAC000506063]QTV79578.1 phosphate/phosphite/phosphonate ABC transporter substrate-binding protein [Microbacterium sp. NIBRBAC000506063]